MGQRPETQRLRDTERECESWRKTGKEKGGECEENGGRQKRKGDRKTNEKRKRDRVRERRGDEWRVERDIKRE